MKKNMMIHPITWLVTAALAVGVAGCAKTQETPKLAGVPRLPESWYRLPEDGSRMAAEAELAEPSAQVGDQFEDTLGAQKDVLEGVPQGAATPAPGNFTPWHLAAFMTDLSVSASGVLGSLTIKGTPALSLIWRKKEAPKTEQAQGFEAEALADVAVAADMPAEQFDGQLDAAVRAAMATGRVKDETRLRRELGNALGDFRELTRGLDQAPMQEWFASRVRMDVLVDASGKVAFFTSLGTEVRLRFEWHRIKRPSAAHAPAPAVVSTRVSSFNELVGALASDLSVLTAPGAALNQGYQPYVFRVGVGVTAGGTFGVVKSSATAIGQVYFSRDVPKPSLKPQLAGMVARAPALSVVREEQGEITFIESDSRPEHLSFARANSIRADDDGGALGQVIYKVNRAQLRKGLARAERMAGFFARRAHHVRSGKWGLYEIRAGYDMSVSGKFGIATVGGLATAEIGLYNEEF